MTTEEHQASTRGGHVKARTTAACGASPQPHRGSEIFEGWEEISEFDECREVIEIHQQPAVFSLGASAPRKWIPLLGYDTCSNQTCKKSLRRLGWPNYCHRCKETFCKKCTNFERRLNRQSRPDPNGRLFKVCQQCYAQGPQPLGQTFCHMEFFKFKRRNPTPTSQAKKVVRPLTNFGNFTDRINYESESTRLKDGFMNSVGSSELRRTLVDFTSMLSKPDWQKSTFCVYNEICSPSSCCICSSSFVLTRSSKVCCVCGAHVCRDCSSKDLLVFIPDDRKQQPQAHLAVIKVIGCPEREPDLSLYLRICERCRHVLCEKQIHQHQAKPPPQTSFDADDRFWTPILAINDELRLLEVKVEGTMPKYQALIEALEETTTGTARHVTSENKSNMQVLAKAQGDLANHFTTLLMMLLRLKKISPATSAQSVISRNLSRSVFVFYQENRYIFNDLRRKLEGTTPLEVLEYIQEIVDSNVINSSYVTLKQLTFEVLHYTTKHDLNESFVKKLLSAEEVAGEDLQQCVEKSQQDWHDHHLLVNQLLKEQLSHHRLIHPSHSHTKHFGDRYVEMFLLERGEHIVREISMQMTTKCAELSFKRTKDVLMALLKDVRELHVDQTRSEEMAEWVLV